MPQGYEPIITRENISDKQGVRYFNAAPADTGNEGYTIDEPYEYPIQPGTDEWFAIESHADKVEMLQIPQEVLENMTTRALVESVVNYPYFPDMDTFSTPEQGYRAVRDGFNGLQELEARPDGMACLQAGWDIHMVRQWYIPHCLYQQELHKHMH